MKKQDYNLLLNIVIIFSFTMLNILEFSFNNNMKYTINLWFVYFIYKILAIK